MTTEYGNEYEELLERQKVINWLRGFNTNSATDCFTAVQELKKKWGVDINEGVLCWKCRRVVPYSIYSRVKVRNVNGKEFEYVERYGVCSVCKEEIMVPGLDDVNERIFDSVYRGKMMLEEHKDDGD